METTICRVVSFGRGGHSEEYCSRTEGSLSYGPSSLSGYDRPHNWEPREGVDYSRAVVINKLPALETEAGFSWVFKGPMVSPDLEPGAVDKLGEVSPIMAMAMAENPYGQLLAVAESQRGNPEPGSLDHVSPEEYAAGWQERGAIIGHVEKSGRICWHDPNRA